MLLGIEGRLMDQSWEDMVAGADTWSPTEIQTAMTGVARRLRDVITLQRGLADELSAALSDYEYNYHRLHLESSVDPAKGDWTVAMHESYAKVETHGLNTTRLALKERKSAVRSEIDALQSILEVLRSANRNVRELAGGTR